MSYLSPGSVYIDSGQGGRHGTSSGGCAAFWVNINGVLVTMICIIKKGILKNSMELCSLVFGTLGQTYFTDVFIVVFDRERNVKCSMP